MKKIVCMLLIISSVTFSKMIRATLICDAEDLSKNGVGRFTWKDSLIVDKIYNKGGITIGQINTYRGVEHKMNGNILEFDKNFYFSTTTSNHVCWIEEEWK